MKKISITILSLLTISNSFAQFLSDFEDFSLAPESAFYGQDQVTDGDTILQSGYCSLSTNYNSGWGSYSGWAVSNVTDNTTPGWANQFSSIAGGGDLSTNYGICYVSDFNSNAVYFNDFEDIFDYVMITNTTYAYYSMLDGDNFSKPFGADTNAQGVIDGTNGEDWFLLTLYGLGSDSLRTGDSVNFYLADFRFSNDAQDYIVNYWEPVDISIMQPIFGLEFELSSSDTTGGFGMNTPAYFALDNFGFYGGVGENEISKLEVYPNPTNGIVKIQTEINEQISIYDAAGKIIFTAVANTNSFEIDLSDFENGLYFITAVSGDEFRNAKVIKN
jgi:hypothetical protein